MKAILVAITTKYDIYDTEYSLNELNKLAKVAGYEEVERVTQSLEKPTAKTYIGSGKLDEIKVMVDYYNIDCVIFNDELTPAQIRNIAERLECDIIDRTFLILKIFEMVIYLLILICMYMFCNLNRFLHFQSSFLNYNNFSK